MSPDGSLSGSSLANVNGKLYGLEKLTGNTFRFRNIANVGASITKYGTQLSASSIITTLYNSGFKNNGSSFQYVLYLTSVGLLIQWVPYYGSSTCPTGYTLSGTTCTNTVAATTNYTCPTGGTLSGTICTNTVISPAIENRTYSYPEGTLYGAICTKQIEDIKPGVCNSGYTYILNQCVEN